MTAGIRTVVKEGDSPNIFLGGGRPTERKKGKNPRNALREEYKRNAGHEDFPRTLENSLQQRRDFWEGQMTQ